MTRDEDCAAGAVARRSCRARRELTAWYPLRSVARAGRPRWRRVRETCRRCSTSCRRQRRRERRPWASGSPRVTIHGSVAACASFAPATSRTRASRAAGSPGSAARAVLRRRARSRTCAACSRRPTSRIARSSPSCSRASRHGPTTACPRSSARSTTPRRARSSRRSTTTIGRACAGCARWARRSTTPVPSSPEPAAPATLAFLMPSARAETASADVFGAWRAAWRARRTARRARDDRRARGDHAGSSRRAPGRARGHLARARRRRRRGDGARALPVAGAVRRRKLRS